MHVAFAFCLLLQAEQASDRLEIKQPLETWYRIEQGFSKDDREHRGWARERIRPVQGQAWKYEYEYESDGKFLRYEPNGDAIDKQVRERVTARLGAGFEVMALEAEVDIAGRRAKLDVRGGADGTVTDITSLDGRSRRVTEAGEGSVLYTLPVSLLRERQRGGLRTVEKKEVVLVDALYDFDDMRLRRDVRREGRVAVGERRMPVVAVEFRPGRSEDPAKTVIRAFVDRQGRIIEVVGDGEAYVRSVAASEAEAKPSGAEQGAARRDPMDPPRAPEARPAPASPEEIAKLAKEIQRRARRVVETAKTDAAAADDLYEDLRRAHAVARARSELDPVAQGGMDEEVAAAHRAVGAWEHERRLSERQLARVRAATQRLDAAEARSGLEALRELSTRAPGRKDLATNALEAGALVESIAAHAELAAMKFVLKAVAREKKAVQVQIEATVCIFSTATTLETRVQMYVRHEWAYINGEAIRVGEDVAGGVRLTAVAERSATLTYKGATREIQLE